MSIPPETIDPRGGSIAALDTEAPPKVSVAIMTYNQREYLQECLDSILAQDYPNVEIVIADDGSTDGSQEIAKLYAKRHPGRFVLKLSPMNCGITATANAAHFGCTGDYISWMGGDDVMMPGKLRQQVELMESDPSCVLCYHDLDVFLSTSGKTLYRFSERNKPREGDVRVAIRYGTFHGACATMHRRRAAPQGGLDRRIQHAADWLYWVETLAGGGRIAYIDQVLGRYRRHDRNITSSPFVRSLIEDNILSCVIMLKMLPRYAPEIFYAMSRNLVALARRSRGEGRGSMMVLALMVFSAFLLTLPFVALARASSSR